MRGGERGFAILLSLGAGTLLSAMAVGLLLSTSTDVQIAAASHRALEARHAAEAGAHRAAIDLALITDWNRVLEGSFRSSFVDGPPNGVRVLAGAPPVDLDAVRSLAECGSLAPCSEAERQTVTRARPWGADNPRWQLFAHAPLRALLPAGAAVSPFYVVVLVGDDPADADGDPARDATPPHPGAGVLRIRSEAFGPAGAHAVVELVAGRPGVPVPALRLVTWWTGP
jgi:hypothetical protein